MSHHLLLTCHLRYTRMRTLSTCFPLSHAFFFPPPDLYRKRCFQEVSQGRESVCWGPAHIFGSLPALFQQRTALVIQVAQQFSGFSPAQDMLFCWSPDRKDPLMPEHGQRTNPQPIWQWLSRTRVECL